MNKKVFSTIAAATVGTIAAAGLIARGSLAFAEEGAETHAAAGEKSCAGEKKAAEGDKKADEGDKKCSGDMSCSAGACSGAKK